MSFNNGRERRKFEAAWKKLRMEYAAAGMDAEAIEEMYQFDLETFRSERRYAEHTQGSIVISGKSIINQIAQTGIWISG